MQVITMEMESFKKIISSIEKLEQVIEKKLDKKINNQEWLDNQDVCDILKVSTRTLQNYRDSGILGFSKVESKILYRKEEVDKMLIEHYKPPFKKK